MADNKIPIHWQTKKLGEVCNILDNLRKPINSSERQKRISGKKKKDLFPYYGATGQVGWIDSFITDNEYILVGEDGAPFLDLFKDKAYKIKGKTWVNNHAHILEGKKNTILNDFALHYLNSINYREYVNGTTRLKLTKTNLIDIPFILPPIFEQQAIVSKIEELLSDLENGKQQLQLAQQQLKVYRQSLLKWAFEDGLLRKGWKKARIKDVAITFGGYAFKSGEFLNNGKYQVLRMGNVRPGRIRYNESPVFLNEVDSAVLNRSLLQFNDVIITQTGTRKKRDYGFTALIQKNNLLVNQRIAVIHFKDSYLPKFFLYYSWTDIFKDQFFENETGNVGQGNVGMRAITETLIPFCSVNEQQEIVDELESKLIVCDKIEETINLSLQQAETLRQSILKKAFEGKLIQNS
jgi:type I restriction enzyme, S subunit